MANVVYYGGSEVYGQVQGRWEREELENSACKRTGIVWRVWQAHDMTHARRWSREEWLRVVK